MNYPLHQVDFHLFPRTSFKRDEIALWQSIHLPAPPDNRSEIEKVRAIQAGPVNQSQIQREQFLDPLLEQFGLDSTLGNEAVTFMSPYILHAKLQFGRRRPHEYGITPTILVPDHPAYPSGHATQAHLLAKVATCLQPSRRDEFQASAESVALNRVKAGVHYPSDSDAGKMLADQIACATMRHLHQKGLVPDACLCSIREEEGGSLGHRCGIGQANHD